MNLTTRGDIALDNTFDLTVSGFSAVDLSPCEIGGTGLILAATGVELDLSRTWSPPEVLAAGFDESFLGVYLGTATVQLPDWLTGDACQPVTLGVTGGVIGSGGFGGALHLSGPPLAARLFGFGLTLESADLAFTQSTVSGGGLSGTLRLPFFENDVGVAITVSADGQVQVTIDDPAADGGLLTLPVAGVGQLEVSSLRVDTSQAAPAIEVSGTFVPSAVAGLALPGISVDGLRIAADGTVTVGAIGLTLPDQLAGMLAASRWRSPASRSAASFATARCGTGSSARRACASATTCPAPRRGSGCSGTGTATTARSNATASASTSPCPTC